MELDEGSCCAKIFKVFEMKRWCFILILRPRGWRFLEPVVKDDDYLYTSTC